MRLGIGLALEASLNEETGTGSGAIALTFAATGTGNVFDPTQTGTNVLWLQSDVGVTLDGSNKVTAWVDRSPAANSLTGTGGSNPAVSAGELNSRQAIVFTGSEVLFKSATAMITGAYHWFLVFKPTQVADGGVWCSNSGANDGVFIRTSTSRRIGHANVAEGTDGNTQTSAYECIDCEFSNTGAIPIFRVNGVSQAIAGGPTTINAPNASTARVTVGARWNSTGTPAFDLFSHSKICFVSCESAPLSSGNRTKMYNMLNALYGLSLS